MDCSCYHQVAANRLGDGSVCDIYREVVGRKLTNHQRLGVILDRYIICGCAGERIRDQTTGDGR